MDRYEQENSSIHKDANTRMTLNDLFLLHLQNEEKRFLKDSKITKCAPFKRSYNVSCLCTMIFFALRRVIMHYDVELMVFKVYYTFMKQYWSDQFKVIESMIPHNTYLYLRNDYINLFISIEIWHFQHSDRRLNIYNCLIGFK